MIIKIALISFITASVLIGFSIPFDKLAQGLIVLPIMHLILKRPHEEHKKGIRESESKNETDSKNETNSKTEILEIYPLQMANFRRYSPLTALIFGILIFFGSAFYNLINLNNLTVMGYLVVPFIGASIIMTIIWLYSQNIKKQTMKSRGSTDQINRNIMFRKFLSFSDPQTLLLFGLIISVIGLFASILNIIPIVWILLGPIILMIFVFHVVSYAAINLNEKNLGRGLIYLGFLLTLFAFGFILNGIKGLVIMQFVFLEFKDGGFIVRESQDPLDFNAPRLTNIIYTAANAIIAFVLWGYAKISAKIFTRKSTAE